ncbi:MAG: hypothetical protein AAGJ28_01395 [Pseudomonadota bacterium]
MKMLARFVVLLDGTIGVGKSTMGRQLAIRFRGTFLDGDDYKVKGKPWYCSSLTTCRSLRDASSAALEKAPVVFIARPMRCLDWLYFSRHFERKAIRVFSIGLQASLENITDDGRGRAFSQRELDRMAEMIRQNYGARPYSEFHVRTDQMSVSATVDILEEGIRRLTDT